MSSNLQHRKVMNSLSWMFHCTLQNVIYIITLLHCISCEIVINSDTLAILKNGQVICQGTVHHSSFTDHNKLKWVYSVAQFDLTNTTQRSIFSSTHQTVQFIGSRSVSITSNGDLEINSALNLNGKSLDFLDGSQNVGGYALKKRSCCVVGAGPGKSFLNHGGGHGGRGGGYMKDWSSGEIYGGAYGSRPHLVGGSTGATVYNSDPGSGGGALELIVAGRLTLGASLTANGFSPGNSNTSYCSGGSAGGRLIIKANEFVSKDTKVVIEAKGADGGWQMSTGKFCGDGGGGGVVSIECTKIAISSLPDVNGGDGLAKGEKGLLNMGAIFDTDLVHINTTDCLLSTHDSGNVFRGTLLHYSEAGTDSTIWETKICVLQFDYNVTFGLNATANLSGPYPIEIRSKYGDITINTEFLLDGGPLTYDGEATRLGGFDNLHQNTNGGPGSYENYATHACYNNPKSYGILTRSYLGGSSCTDATLGVSIGGGSIRLKATKGKIMLDSRISANAFSDHDLGCGASGGTIDLLAKEVIFGKHALLLANGSPGHNGGDGGVIHLSSQKPVENDYKLFISVEGGVGQGTSGCHGDVKVHDIWQPIEAVITTVKPTVATAPRTTNEHRTVNFLSTPKPFILDNGTLIEKLKHINRSSSSFHVLQRLESLTKNESLSPLETFESVAILTEVMGRNKLPEGEDVSENLVEQVVHTASTIISASARRNTAENVTDVEKEANFTYVPTRNKILPYLAERVDQFGQSIVKRLNLNETIVVHTENIGLEIHPLDLDHFNGCYFPGCKVGNQIGEIREPGNTIYLPGDIFANASRDSFMGVTFVHVRGIESEAKWFTKDRKIVKVVSDLLTISTSSNITQGFSRPIIITHDITAKVEENQELPVGFWQEEEFGMWNGSWAIKGCESERINGMVQSKCFHMTTFAVLMQVNEFEVSEDHKTAMSIISYVGSSISLIGLLLTFGTFMSIRTLLSERNIIHCHLVIALGLAQIVFMAGIEATSNRMVCKAVAVSLHYLFTASFAWMLAEGIHLYIKVVSVFSQVRKMRLYYVLGWGLPMVVVALSFATRPEGYGNDRVCWISIRDGLIWAFVAPVLVIIICNTIVIGIVVRILVRSVSATERVSKVRSQVRYGARAMSTLLPLLGLTWIIGIAAVNEQSVTLQYIFCVLNSLQGMFIFLFHCFGNTEVRIACKRYHEKHTLSRSIGERGSAKRKKLQESRSLSFKRRSYTIKDNGHSGTGYDEDVMLQSRRAILDLINRQEGTTIDTSCSSQGRSVYAMPSTGY